MILLRKKTISFQQIIIFLLLATVFILFLTNFTGIQFYILLFNKEKASRWLAQNIDIVEPIRSVKNETKELCGPLPSGLMGSFRIKDPPLEVNLFTINTNFTLIRRVELG